MHDEFYSLTEKLTNILKTLYGFGGLVSTMCQESLLDPCSTLEHQTCSNKQSQHDLLYNSVSLLISLNLKLTPDPCPTAKWPIITEKVHHRNKSLRQRYNS